MPPDLRSALGGRGLLGSHLLDVVAQQLVLLWKREQYLVGEIVAWVVGSCSSRRGNDKSGLHQGR